MIVRPAPLLPITMLLVTALAASAIDPFDRLTWLMEVLPVMLVVPVLWLTARRFPLTTLLYVGILVHSLVLILGGTYTYARVPLGQYLADWLELARNPYDKIGHFFQGLVPALAAREILIRGSYVRGRRMTGFLVVCVVLAISASYELIEWWAALAMGQGADEFLGTQGDPWDTQSDMFCALLGALATLLALAPAHDRQLTALAARRGAPRQPQSF
ncbi:MAG: DUF2238 domain-containing protein [Rhodocyclaceae bacterium]|nr:DUF2238 domain-containing protein [Rhodocyclaceae bacterium]